MIGPLTQTAQAIGSALREAPSQTGAEILTAFRGLSTRWQGQLSQLRMLKPPSDLAGDFIRLISAGARVASDLTAIVTAIATHNKAAGEQAVATIVTDIAAAHSADAVLEQKLGTT